MIQRITGRLSRGSRDPGADELGQVLDDLRDRIRDLEQADQGGQRSIDDAALDVYDDNDNLRGRIGRQSDGSFGVKTFAPKPATPTEPDVIPVPGGCVVEWEGTFEEAQEEPVQRVAIHVGTEPDFEINDDDDEDSDGEATEKAAILSPRGGSAFLALDPGVETYYVRLTAVAEGGVESDPTDAVEVIIAAPEAAFYEDEFTLPVEGAQELELTFTPLDYSDHLYWSGLYQREDVTWTRIGNVVTLTGTPYAPRAGDRVTVEYAYNAGEEPKPKPHPGASLVNIDGDDAYMFGGLQIDRGSFTMHMLVKLTTIPGANRTLAGQTLFPGWQDAWEVGVNAGGGLRIRANHASGSVSQTSQEMIASGGTLADQVAHRLLLRYNHLTGRYWLTLDTAVAVELTLPYLMVECDQLLIGNRYIQNAQPGALIQDVAFWKRLVTDDEAADMMLAWKRRGDLKETIVATAPLAYWPMDLRTTVGPLKALNLMSADPASGTGGLNFQGGQSTALGASLQKGK